MTVEDHRFPHQILPYYVGQFATMYSGRRHFYHEQYNGAASGRSRWESHWETHNVAGLCVPTGKDVISYFRSAANRLHATATIANFTVTK